MRLRFTIPLWILVAAPLAAQATPEQSANGWLRVAVPDLNVRFVPELGEENVWCIVRQGQTLRLIGENPKWYIIEPPPEAECLILGTAVEKSSTLRGVVRTGDRSAPVRVAPLRSTDAGGFEKLAILSYQSDGAEVEIRGEQGDWLRIQPPVGVMAYVIKDDTLIERVESVAGKPTDAPVQPIAATATPPSPPPVSGAGRSVVDLAPVSGTGGALPVPTAAMNANSSNGADSDVHDMQPVGGVAPAAAARTTEDRVRALMQDTRAPVDLAPEPVKVTTSAEPAEPTAAPEPLESPTPTAPEAAPESWRARFSTIDRAIFAEAAKSVADRNWQALIADLMPIASQNEDPPVAALAQWRIGDLRERLDNREFLAQIDAAVHAPNPLPAVRYEEWRVRTNNPTSQPILWSAPFFDARGVVMVDASADAGSPTRMRLVDPFSGMAIAFVDIGGADPTPILNHYVGVRGWTEFDQTLGLRVIRVRELQILPPPIR